VRLRFPLLALVALLAACQPAEPTPFRPTEPDAYARILYPADNPTTLEGLALGRDLFYDPILSADSTISCASCHLPELAFTDGRALSTGISGRPGRRNSPSLTNIGYLHQTLFWDGRADDLESQALHPVADPNEMGGSWPLLISKLRRHPAYWPAFRRAFGLGEARELTPDHVGKALAQFQRSLISADTKYDRVQRGEATFTAEETIGHAIFFDLADEPATTFATLPTGECAHCHIPPHFTNQRFFNNGLDEVHQPKDFADAGRGAISGSPGDYGKFRAPGLRNLALTAPYMHDGRMNTLEEVVEHYNTGGHYAANRSANIYPLGLKPDQAAALVAFLKTLTDSSFVNNPAYRPRVNALK
jgi:cytochrome c peroxidase